VTGEPGIGKSRLVNELAERQRDSAVVVGSRAFELGMTYSLALWVEAFESCSARHLRNARGTATRGTRKHELPAARSSKYQNRVC
jgi:predicted ATPase